MRDPAIGDDCVYGGAGLPVRRWREYAKHLVAQLTGAGLLLDTRWQDAALNVPRHLFVTGIAEPAVVTEKRLAAIYTDPTLSLDHVGYVPILDEATGQAPPSVLAWTLDHLSQSTEPLRVLQVGAGSGYLTALLCAGIGDRHVVATEHDPCRADATRETLADLGWHPEIITGRPGSATVDHGRYDVALIIEPAPGPDSSTDASVGRERVACLSQLTARGRLIVSGPSNSFATHPVAMITRSPVDRLSCRLADPHSTVRTERLFVEFLANDSDLRAVLLGSHVTDSDGCCRACAQDDGHLEPAPCRVAEIAKAAARLATRRLAVEDVDCVGP